MNVAAIFAPKKVYEYRKYQMASSAAATTLDIKITARCASREPARANPIANKVTIAATTIGAIFDAPPLETDCASER
jgi:hypothetical protein